MSLNQPHEKTGRYNTGFSLIELVITMVILGFSSLILAPFFQSITSSPDPMIRERAVSLGQALMDEILTKKWDENTPVGGGPICTGESWDSASRSGSAWAANECSGALRPSATNIVAEEGSRADWDDIDDYNGFFETDTFRDQTGGSPVSFNGFSRSAAIDYIASNTILAGPVDQDTAGAGTSGGNAATDSKRIVVTVTSPLQETYIFVAIACNF